MLFEQTGEGVFMAGPQGRYLEVNPQGCKMLGYSREEILNLSVPDLMPAEELAAELHPGSSGRHVRHLRCKDGRSLPVEVSSHRLSNGNALNIVRDISSQVEAEAARRESEARFRAFMDHNPAIAWMKDEQGRYVYLNQTYRERMGIRQEEWLGKTIFEVWPPEVAEEFWKNDLAVLTSNQPLQVIEETRNSVGDPQYWWIYKFPFQDAVGQRYIGGLGLDITARKQAEETLRMFRHFMDQALTPIFWMDKEARFVYVNEQACRALGYSREELLGLSLWDIDPVFPKERWHAKWMQYQQQGPWEGEYLESCHRRKEGSLFPVEVASNHLQYGEQELHVAFVQDISARKETEKALQESHQLFRTLFQFSPAAMVLSRLPEGRFVEVNESFLKMTGYSLPDVLGKTSAEIGLRNDPKQRQQQLTTLKREGRLLNVEMELTTKAGQILHGLTSVAIVSIKDEQFILSTFLDVTEQRQATDLIKNLNQTLEQQVVERTVQLQDTNKELEAFAYSISHDLRAPLRAVDGYTRILQEDYAAGLDEEAKRVCDVIRAETRRMGQLIDDLLTLSRLNRAALQPVVIDMARLATWAFNDLTATTEQERVEWVLGQLPPALGDATLIRQVWFNLIGNALKFSSKRERARIEVGSRPDLGETVYYVRDNGAGFDMRYANKLFGVFQRLHSEREFPGTGVGLAIVQRAIHRHGGRVWAEGQLDAGAAFYFTLPH